MLTCRYGVPESMQAIIMRWGGRGAGKGEGADSDLEDGLAHSEEQIAEARAQGFIPIDEDSCVYIRRRRNGEITMLLLYVDDIICSASSKEEADSS